MANTAKYLIMNFKRKYKLIVSERSNPHFISDKEMALEKKIFKKSDGIIFQTERVTKNYIGLEEKSIVIPNAVGNEYVYQADVEWKCECRKSIAAVGRLDSQKDYLVMIKAFQMFQKTHRDYILEIYGEGDDREKIEQFISTNYMQENVFLRGTCSDAIVKISDANCYLLTSICEGMPNSLMEAMSIGMPCIATDCEYGPAELIKDGENGLLVPVGDVEAISRALCRMVDDREFAIKCGTNAKEILKTNSIESISCRFRDYIYHVLEGKGQ